MTKIKTSLFYVLLVFFTFTAHGQESEFLNYFNAKQIGNETLLSFELKSGATCLGIVIERRIGQENFQSIGLIDGVCGSPDVPEAYTFRDDMPMLGANNVYRLALGGLGASGSIEILIVDLENGGYTLQLAQGENPARLYFRNDLSDQVMLTFYDLLGHVLYETKTNEMYVDLPTHLPIQQIIVFHLLLLDSKKSLKGKLMVF